jgi:rfaE bifunctional protein kinase chain/domain
MSRFNEIISSFKSKKILVVGDLILDQYLYGQVSRVSPEAPVPVVLQQGEAIYTPGGAANVANNLRCLGAQVFLVGRIGKDREAQILKGELNKRKIDISGVLSEQHFPTALKTRVIAQQQQIVRIDREKSPASLLMETNEKILSFIEHIVSSVDALIVSDYGKGVITQPLVSRICRLARQRKKIITVDPKVEHFHYYAKVTAITPNKKELENAIRNIIITHPKGRQLNIKNDVIRSLTDVRKAGKALLDYLRLDSLLVTLGDQGMCLFEKKESPFFIETKAREVFDVTGAGDTVISVFTLALTAGATKRDAAELANYAAGYVVGKTGAVAVTPKNILQCIEGVSQS